MAKKVITNEFRNEAERLANRSYIFTLEKDETTKGEPIFLALNPELPGCMSHGKTEEEALNNLKEARIDYIQTLLIRNLIVPEPTRDTNSPRFEPIIITTSYSVPPLVNFGEGVDLNVKPEDGKKLIEAWIET